MNNFKKYYEEKIADKKKIKNYVYSKGNKEENFMNKKLIAALSVVMLLVVVAISFNGQVIMNAVNPMKYSYVTIDINPSVELTVDENDKVVEVVTLNDDADVAYDDLALVGKNVEEATEMIVDEARELGYIGELNEDNMVNITTYADKDQERLRINKLLTDCLNDHFEKLGIGVLVVQNGLDEELKTKADGYDISYGKMLLINRAITLNDKLVETDLVKMTIKEINGEIKTTAQDRREKLINQYREQKRELKEVKQQLKTECQERLRLQKQAILNENNGDELSEQEQQQLLERQRLRIRTEINETNEEIDNNDEAVRQRVRQRLMNPDGSETQIQSRTQTQAGRQS